MKLGFIDYNYVLVEKKKKAIFRHLIKKWNLYHPKKKKKTDHTWNSLLNGGGI